MKFVAAAGAFIGLAMLATITWAMLNPGTTPLELGTFIVLGLTLIALIAYAYDTHALVLIEQDRWKRASVLGTTYSMEIAGAQQENPRGRTLFRIHNPSALVIRAKVWCNFKVYHAQVEYNDDFNGANTWYAFPAQVSQGWFEIASLVEKAGKDMKTMVADRTPDNWDCQLTMNLQLEFRDELNNKRQLPPRIVFFDFHDWRWIPILTRKDDWSG